MAPISSAGTKTAAAMAPAVGPLLLEVGTVVGAAFPEETNEALSAYTSYLH